MAVTQITASGQVVQVVEALAPPPTKSPTSTVAAKPKAAQATAKTTPKTSSTQKTPAPSASSVKTVVKAYQGVTGAQQTLSAYDAIAFHVRDVAPTATRALVITGEKKLASAKGNLNTAIQAAVLPDQSQGYKTGVVSSGATALEAAVHNSTLDGYIDQSSGSLQRSLNGLFGKPGDSNSLRTQIEDGNWTGAQRTEAVEMAKAGKGISNLTNSQTAMAGVAGKLLKYGPDSSGYETSINKAFDGAAVQPLVKSLDRTYSDPASQVPRGSTNALAENSRAGAFAAAYKSDMQGSIPVVRMGLTQDLLGQSQSPLLATANDIRTASNNTSLTTNTPWLVQVARLRASGGTASARIPTLRSGANIWGISSTQELDSAYSDLAAGTDLAAIGDTVGTGTGIIHQVAGAVLGNPNAAGHANLTALDPGIRNAAAQGNANLSAEIAGILQTSGDTSAASKVLGVVGQGVTQFQQKVDSDVASLGQLPKALQVPAGTLAELFSGNSSNSNASSAVQSAISKYIAANPGFAAQLQAKENALDLDGQGVVRTNYAVEDMLPTLMSTSGGYTLETARDQLVDDPNALTAIKASPSAQGEIAYQEDLTAAAYEANQNILASAKAQPPLSYAAANQSWATPRGPSNFPAGNLWVGRDVTSMFATTKSKGVYALPYNALTFPGSPFRQLDSLNLNLTGTVAQQINDRANALFGSGAPVNLAANQEQISQLNNRSVVLQFGPWKTSNQTTKAETTRLTEQMKTSPEYQTWQGLQNKLAVASDPNIRLRLMTQISKVQGQTVEQQLDWMTQQANGMDPDATVNGKTQGQVLDEVGNLRTSYQAAQQKMQGIYEGIVGSQTPPTAKNTLTWLNLAGQIAHDGEGLPATLQTQLNEFEKNDPAAYQSLMSGTYAGSVDALPDGVVGALQQYVAGAEESRLGTGPKPGLLPTADGGLAFSALKTLEMVGGSAYLTYLGMKPGGSWLSTAFGVTLGVFSGAPSVAEFGSALAQKALGSSAPDATLFTRGISSGKLATALGSLASWAWTPLMGIWSAEEIQAHDPTQAIASAAMGASYLLPEIFADSAWAAPVSSFVDLAGVIAVLGDTLTGAYESVNQYNGAITTLLQSTGLHSDIAANLAQPDSQGISAAVRMGQVFDSLPYYNTSNSQVNTQRRVAFLNSLTPSQTAFIGQGLLDMPVNKSGQVAKTGALNVVIAPPSTTLSPDAVKQYYDTALSKEKLPLPTDPGTEGIRPSEFANYYQEYVENLTQSGNSSVPGGQLNSLVNPDAPDPSTDQFSPNNVRDFLYYAASMGFPLAGSFG